MKYTISNHAVCRYIERVKPLAEFEAAQQELEVLIAQAGEPHGKPEWYFLPEQQDRASEFYLTLSDGIIAALKDEVVATVIVRGGGSPAFKGAKKARRQAERRRRQGPPVIDLKNGRREERKRIWR